MGRCIDESGIAKYSHFRTTSKLLHSMMSGCLLALGVGLGVALGVGCVRYCVDLF